MTKTKQILDINQHIVEIVSDSGEGAQTAGQMFGTISAKMGNGVWTVEIIPAEVEPPQRSRAGASGNRIRIGREEITNAGDFADVVFAFNEQVLYSRIDQSALRKGTVIFLDRKWSESPIEEYRTAYAQALVEFKDLGYELIEVPLEEECMKILPDPRRGKNIWVVGLLCQLYQRDLSLVEKEIERKFKKKGEQIIQNNLRLLHSGHEWAAEHVDFQFNIPPSQEQFPKVVMNGNQAIGMGAMAAGFELISMYPITPATSVSHYMAGVFHEVGGVVHQAEDEIAAIGFALGASYAGKTALTVTSGPGLALKTEFMGLSVMSEIPLVLVNVQRGGPSTGLPTKVEQADLLATLYGQPGDAPKVVIAPATIEECFHCMIMARELAERFRGLVVVLTDANLATGVQPFPRPKPEKAWLSPPLDQSQWDTSLPPYQWDDQTGFSPRPIPGQRDGMYVLTGLAHNEKSKVAYESDINQRSMAARSRKLATIQKTLSPPQVMGKDSGDLLVVGWGSTKGAIEEAVCRMQKEGKAVSSTHLRFLSPMEPGLKDLFNRFSQVVTVEINYSDDPDDGYFDEENRRYAQLAMLLRAKTLVDVKSWSRVPGYPLQPGIIYDALNRYL